MSSEQKRRRWFGILTIGSAAAVIAAVMALAVPIYRAWLAKSQLATCMSRAQSIARGIRNYGSEWNGWFNPDRDYYVKMAGYRLSTEQGYDASDAERVEDFCCPADPSPRRNRHGYRSSYRPNTVFSGSSLVSTMPPVVYETRRNHTEGNRLKGVYVLADMRVQLGYDGPPIPGLKLEMWRSADEIYQGARDEYPEVEPAYESDWWMPVEDAQLAANYDSVHDAVAGRTEGREESYDRDQVTIRFHGLIVFPEEGNWGLRVISIRQAHLWFDSDRNDRLGETEVLEHPGGSSGKMDTHRCGVLEAKKPYRFRFVFFRERGDEAAELRWVTPDGKEEPIPGTALFHTLN